MLTKFINLVLLCIVISNCQKKEKEELTSPRNLIAFNLLSRCTSLDVCFDRFASGSGNGANITIIRPNGTILYQRETRGNLAALSRTTYSPIFSASKWITAAVTMAAIEDTSNNLSLNTTVSSVMPEWTGTKGSITIRQLLAFTSGLHAANRGGGSESCINTLPAVATGVDKDSCLTNIRNNTSSDAPGAFFVYNSNHMAVVQRLLERRLNQTWAQIFTRYIAGPSRLNFDATQAVWSGAIGSATQADGSLSGAYGLALSGEHYTRFIQMLLNDGVYVPTQGSSVQILSAASVRAILQDQYETNTQIGFSQFAAFGYRWRYGLGNWRFCSTPDNISQCETDLVSHSFGANGFYPWIDKVRGYGVVVATNIPAGGFIIPNSASSLFFGEDAKPFIIRLLSN